MQALSGVKQEETPTIGFNIEKVKTRDFNFSVWDVGGQTELRDLWRHYYPGTNAIVWVVDSADRKRMAHSNDTNSNVCNIIKMITKPKKLRDSEWCYWKRFVLT